MVNRKGLGQANILRTNNNTSTGYGIVYADEVSGHRTVANLTALYALNDWQLSASGDNTGSDAIGQLWYVVNADGNGNGCYYQLKDWSKRNEAAGWSIADYTTKAELQDKIDNIATADEEDITTEGDTPQTQVLKLKDRAYDSLNASGKGYKILRKNWQTINGERKNVLTQEMINEPNTIYEIRYDFDLNGAEIEIKENCVLNFVGGSFKNGRVLGVGTVIQSFSKCFYNTKLTGFWNCEGRSEWFANTSTIRMDGDSIVIDRIDCTDELQYLLDSSFVNIRISSGLYYITKPLYIRKNVKLELEGEGNSQKLLNIQTCKLIQSTIFTDKNINLLIIDCLDDSLSQKISIKGGSFDASLCSKNECDCIRVELTKANQKIWGLTIDTVLYGCLHKNETNGLFEGTGINFICEGDNAESYASMIRISGSIDYFKYGIKVLKGGKAWITDVKIDTDFGWCGTYIISNVDTLTYSGSIQAASIFDAVLNNYMPCIDLLGGTNIKIDGKIWDVGNNEKNHQVAINISDSVSNLSLGDFLYNLLLNALNRKKISGNKNAIITSDWLYRNPIISNNKFEMRNNALNNGMEGFPLMGGSIIAKYINNNGAEEDVIDYTRLERAFYCNSPEGIIKFKNEPTDGGTGYIEVTISNTDTETYCNYFNMILLVDKQFPCSDFVTITIKTLDNEIYSEKTSIAKAENVTKSICCECRNPTLRAFREIIIKFEGLRNVNSTILIQSFESNDFEHIGMPKTKAFIPITGGKILKDFEIAGKLRSNIFNPGTSTYNLTGDATKLLKYADFYIQPIHAFYSNNVEPWAVLGQMSYENRKGRPLWRNSNAYNSDNPMLGWSDALGNPANINYYGTNSERPTTVKIGFVYFDTTLNSPIWWTGKKWVNSDGINITLMTKGDSDNRPRLTSTDEGFEYYDSTLKKKILWNGTAWVNMDGSSLG